MESPRTHLCRGLLFDMDGTILDSIPAANRAWGSWAASVGIADFTLEGSVHGLQRPELVRHLLPDLSDDEIARHAEDIRIAERDDVAGIVPLDGAHALLESLPFGSWGVVTSCDAEVAVARIKEAGLPLPEVMITSDVATKSKPDPMGFLMGAEALGFSPDECIVFEDSPAGVRAGLAAGMRVIATRHTQANDEYFTDCIEVIDTPAAVSAQPTPEGIKLVVS